MVKLPFESNSKPSVNNSSSVNFLPSQKSGSQVEHTNFTDGVTAKKCR